MIGGVGVIAGNGHGENPQLPVTTVVHPCRRSTSAAG